MTAWHNTKTATFRLANASDAMAEVGAEVVMLGGLT